MDGKNNEMQTLKDELKNANDLLRVSQEENLDNAVEKLAPTAAATSRMLKTGMSLTELYSRFVHATEEVQLEKKENARLSLQMNTILQEIEEKAPIMKKQQIEYKNAMQANAELTQQLESMIQERVNLRQDYNDTSSKIGYYEREISKLKAERGDLGRQVSLSIQKFAR
jgi:nucleoprotein TPR